jgi:hypothetical protein
MKGGHMAVSGVNNMLNTYKVLESNRPKNAPTINPDNTNNQTDENIKKTAARNNAVNSTNTDNRNIADLKNKPKILTTPSTENVQKDQAQVTKLVNNVQKLPNGMDMVQQGVIQNYKGVNRLA